MVSIDSQLESAIGVSFGRPELLREAFAHRSYLNENPEPGLQSNERLEFLGDAVIGYVIAEQLFKDCAECTEGDLTERRGHLVKGDSLARFARRLGLGAHFLLGRGEEAAGGRDRTANLAGLFEAVVGAVALDQGLEEARKFIMRAMGDEVESLKGSPTPVDPKSRLQEVVQGRWQRVPSYRTVKEEGPEHRKVFTVEVAAMGQVLAQGVGLSKQDAEREAAKRALDQLDSAPPGGVGEG